ncbi:unnamed protein product [Acanthosepion pharaonis]|uniref:Uncharacterized protein n=1 Tax=Acanthosepion pharaonis TaxID=158019 RepID=A0A812EVU8_ACAPH|nr:unnamed protein product [Sepia pharaonis]
MVFHSFLKSRHLSPSLHFFWPFYLSISLSLQLFTLYFQMIFLSFCWPSFPSFYFSLFLSRSLSLSLYFFQNLNKQTIFVISGSVVFFSLSLSLFQCLSLPHHFVFIQLHSIFQCGFFLVLFGWPPSWQITRRPATNSKRDAGKRFSPIGQLF